mmetsp:Transcript_12562/g.31942  ORF Transcript_12562/g.31942 Transcript_12562/m.31942 type:complete len:280 (+) Transcript_12562:873-1712(+)
MPAGSADQGLLASLAREAAHLRASGQRTDAHLCPGASGLGPRTVQACCRRGQPSWFRRSAHDGLLVRRATLACVEERSPRSVGIFVSCLLLVSGRRRSHRFFTHGDDPEWIGADRRRAAAHRDERRPEPHCRWRWWQQQSDLVGCGGSFGRALARAIRTAVAAEHGSATAGRGGQRRCGSPGERVWRAAAHRGGLAADLGRLAVCVLPSQLGGGTCQGTVPPHVRHCTRQLSGGIRIGAAGLRGVFNEEKGQQNTQEDQHRQQGHQQSSAKATPAPGQW